MNTYTSTRLTSSYQPELKITYKLSKFSKVCEWGELDEQVTNTVESLGFRWYACGYNEETGDRSIAFESEYNAKERKKFEIHYKENMENGKI